MADSIGGPGFPRTGIQEGHLHFDAQNNILYVWNGGDPADNANWSEVGGSGVVEAESGGSGVQRWPYKFIGTELSVGFGGSGHSDFVAPAAGTITRWGILAEVIDTEDAIMKLYYDTFNTFTQVDTLTVSGLTSMVKYERVVSQAVVAGDIISVFHENTLNPAAHNVKITGFVDFTPS